MMCLPLSYVTLYTEGRIRLRHMWIKTAKIHPFLYYTIPLRENTSLTYVDKDGPDQPLLIWHYTLKGEYILHRYLMSPFVTVVSLSVQGMVE